ncbi:hypothetical protein Tco_0603815 [Tanacetum coccineum]
MATHNRIYIAPSHIKKIFANMRRQGKEFSSRVTPLFPTMVVQAQEEMGEGSAMPTDPYHIPIINHQHLNPKGNKNQEGLRRRTLRFLSLVFPGRKIHDIDADEDITLENLHDAEMFGVNDLEGDEVVVESEVADKDVNFSVNEVTLAQALAALKSAKVKDKGKGKIVEKEPVKKMSKKELVKLDEELAFKLQAKEDEEERLTREKAQKVKEANIP